MTKKAIITTHDGREATIVTKASNVLFEDGQTAQDILNDRQDTMITPIITTSTSMSKIGQGDSVDYSENVVDGAYESCVLKGNTKVNLIQEPSSKDVVLPYEFTEGQYVTINDTKESGALGVELKGQTLVNLCPKGSSWLNQGAVMWYNKSIPNSLFKPNTKYFLKFNSDLSNILDSCYLGACKPIHNHKIYPSVSGCYAIMTTNEAPDGGLLHVYPKSGIELNSTTLNENVRFVFTEYQEGMENWDIPYFEGMKSVQAPSVTTVGKNLFDMEGFLKSSETNYTVEEDSYKFKIDHAKHHKNGIYTYSGDKPLTISYEAKAETDSRFRLSIVYTDGTHVDMGTIDSTETFVKKTSTTSKNKTVDYIRIAYNISKYVWIKNLQIEESTTPTTYEPYKSSTLTTPEEITLRGIGNVKDTLNTVTGELTQRIGEVVLDGSENWLQHWGITENYIGFLLNIKTNAKNSSNQLCTTLPYTTYSNLLNKDCEWFVVSYENTVCIKISKSKLSTADVSGFKTYLQSNPITIQYELKTPIVTKVSLTFTNQDNQPTTKLSTYNTTTHINASSQEGSLIPTLSHVNPSYPVILKPSTKYSIVANSYSNNHTNSAINFNLGGATVSTTVGNRVCTVTTPSTLTSEKLVMSGRGNKLNNVMVIEGDVVGDEPYFEGICDVKSPILTNTGKNLYYMHQDINNTYGISEFYENGFVTTSLNAMGIFGLTKKTNIAEQGDNILNPTSIQEGKTYTISCKVTKISGTSSKLHFLGLRCHNHEGDVIEVSNVGWNDWELEYDFSNTVELSKTVVCNKSFNHVVFGGQIGFDGSNNVYKITDFQLEETTTPTTYEPYKSNILSCNGDKIELTQDMFEQEGVGGYRSCIGKTYEEMKLLVPSEVGGKRLRIIDLIRVKPNTTYRLHSNDKFSYLVGGFDVNKINNGKVDVGYLKSFIFTTSSDTYYIAIIVKKDDGGTISITDFQDSELMVSEVDKTIVLRSLPNGVCDTLNVETGEYVQRIGEINISDLSKMDNMVRKGGWDNGTYMSFDIIAPDAVQNKTNVITTASNLFPTVVRNLESSESMKEFVTNTASGNLFVMMRKDRLLSADLNGFKQWLEDNDLVIQYELATPIVKIVDLSGYPFSYENGHVILSSGSIEQSLTPTVEYSVPTNRNGQIRSNQKMVEKHQKELDKLQAIILANLVNSQYNQTLTTLNYELSRV